jgi:integration host factor subunit beta
MPAARNEAKTITKAELVEDVANAAELTKKDAERLVEIVLESIVETLRSGEKIELRGFGSFRVRERGSRRGRNPKTGAPVDIPSKRVPYFKPGKELRELINK